MKSKYIAAAVGTLMLFSAAFSAQANTYPPTPHYASGLNAAQISAIISLLQAFNADPAVVANVQAQLSGQPNPSFANLCTAYAHLKRGDYDATTGGQVSQLQAFLGINPTTGYYGVLTSIGYTNKCVSNNSQPISVSGMSKYTDSVFGFSFWYPSGWSVVKHLSGSLSTSPWEILVTNPSNQSQQISILELSQTSVSDASGSYYFNLQSATWMHQTGNISQAADTSNNTMGGLHIFSNYIIPLSANKFLSMGASGMDAKYVVNTIVATDPTVAIPVSTAEQTVTIQVEASTYGVNILNAFSATPTSGNAPLTVTFVAPPSAGGDYMSFGDGIDGCSVPGVTNNGMTGCSVPSNMPFTHTYTQPGVYKVIVDRLLPSTILGTATITVTASTNGY